MPQSQPVVTRFRTITVTRQGSFDAAHHLPGYHGDCSRVHGHRWEVTAEIEFPMVPDGYLDESGGMLVDFRDVSELWEDLDHSDLNLEFNDPTAENIANQLLNTLTALVISDVPDLPFSASIILHESPDSCVAVAVYVPYLSTEELEVAFQ